MAYDVYFEPVPASEVHSYKMLTFGYRVGPKATGANALFCRWIKTFLTTKGSDLLDDQAGTIFGNLVGGNYNGDDTALQDLVVLAINDTNEQVEQQGIAGLLPEDELLQSAEMQRFEMPSPDGFNVWIKVTNQAGTAITASLTGGVRR